VAKAQSYPVSMPAVQRTACHERRRVRCSFGGGGFRSSPVVPRNSETGVGPAQPACELRIRIMKTKARAEALMYV